MFTHQSRSLPQTFQHAVPPKRQVQLAVPVNRKNIIRTKYIIYYPALRLLILY